MALSGLRHRDAGSEQARKNGGDRKRLGWRDCVHRSGSWLVLEVFYDHPTRMRISPTPVTAAAAGFLSATLWPLAWSQFGNGDSSFSTELMVATLLLVALPAHAVVVGFNYRHASDGRALDVPLL